MKVNICVLMKKCKKQKGNLFWGSGFVRDRSGGSPKMNLGPYRFVFKAQNGVLFFVGPLYGPEISSILA